MSSSWVLHFLHIQLQLKLISQITSCVRKTMKQIIGIFHDEILVGSSRHRHWTFQREQRQDRHVSASSERKPRRIVRNCSNWWGWWWRRSEEGKSCRMCNSEFRGKQKSFEFPTYKLRGSHVMTEVELRMREKSWECEMKCSRIT